MNFRHGARIAGFSLACVSGLTLAQSEVMLDPGIACDFGLTLNISGGNLITREFHDKNGKVVRSLQAGKGYTLTFTRTGTTSSYSLNSNGSVSMTRYHADGTTTVSSTGHNVIILFPTDVPAGPSTILYVGRVVYTVDANQVFTLQSFSGRTEDICSKI